MQNNEDTWLQILKDISTGNEDFVKLERIENEIKKTKIILDDLIARRDKIVFELNNQFKD